MKLVVNEHRYDRVARVVLALALLPLLAVGPVPGWGLFGLLGLVFLGTAAMGFCPLYALFGFSTCPVERD